MLLSWITWFGLCIITKYFKGTCLVSQAESTALQEVKACSYSKQLIHKYFIFDEENGGHGGSLVVATGSRLLWDTEKRNRGRSDAFGELKPCPQFGWPVIFCPEHFGVRWLRIALNTCFMFPNVWIRKETHFLMGWSRAWPGWEEDNLSLSQNFSLFFSWKWKQCWHSPPFWKQDWNQGRCGNMRDRPTPPPPGFTKPCHRNRQTITSAGWDFLLNRC